MFCLIEAVYTNLRVAPTQSDPFFNVSPVYGTVGFHRGTKFKVGPSFALLNASTPCHPKFIKSISLDLVITTGPC